MYLKKDSWMIKFEICSAYHFTDIWLPDTEYLTFSFPDKKGVSHYYKVLVLPFGLRVAPFIYTTLTQQFDSKMEGQSEENHYVS